MAEATDEYNQWIRDQEKGRKLSVRNCDGLLSWSLVALELNKSEQAFDLETRRPERTVIL